MPSAVALVSNSQTASTAGTALTPFLAQSKGVPGVVAK